MSQSVFLYEFGLNRLVQVFAQNKQGAPNLSSVQWIKAGVVFAFMPPDIKPAGEVTML